MRQDEDALRAEIDRLRARVTELEQLRSTEATFLQSVLAAIPAFVAQVDADMRIRYINRLQPGRTMEQVIGSNGYEYIAAEYRAAARAGTERALRTGIPQRTEVVGEGPHGEPTHYELYMAPMTDADGARGLCMAAFDVSQHRDREAALHESEEKLRVALSATGIGLWSWDIAENEVQWDARMKQLCGVEGPLGLDAYVEQLVHPEDRELVIEAGRATQSTGEYVGYPHRIVRPDGSIRWMLTSATMLHDEQGKPVRLVGGNLDITEQRQLEEQLRHAQKMEALGNLTAGIAHNLNNMLMVLLPSLELLERVVPAEHRQLARDARESAEHGAEHIRRLKTFAGRRSAAPARSHDVGEIVRKALRMCRGSFAQGIELEAVVANELPAIHCDASALEHVLLNILLNARDALGQAASPRIRVAVDVVAAPQPTRRTSRHVRIRIEDNGVGISPEVQGKIFEPFFTTKSAGSGLGLATSYAIVREHDGWLECSSRPGDGTAMTILLPVTATPATARHDPVLSAPRRGCRILLIDDEEPILRAVARLLGEDGHRVLGVGDLDEALTAAEQHNDVSLVMLDRSMPGACGHAFVRSLRARLPSARIVYFTGHDVPDDERAMVDGVLRKPMTGEALTHAVRTLVATGVGVVP